MQDKLPWFLRAIPSAECAKGGVGGYNNALQLDTADPTGIAGLSEGNVAASSFRTYYTPLNTQQEFIDAYQVCARNSYMPRLCCCVQNTQSMYKMYRKQLQPLQLTFVDECMFLLILNHGASPSASPPGYVFTVIPVLPVYGSCLHSLQWMSSEPSCVH